MSERTLSPLLLTPAQVEALRQLAHLGGADAARSLGKLLHTSVEAAHPKAQVAPRGSLAKVLQPDGAAFIVHFSVDGGARLRWLLHVTHEGAMLMSGLLLGSPLLGEMAGPATTYTSALAEAANIAVSSYVGGVGAAVGLTLVPSVPHVARGSLAQALHACFGHLDPALLLVSDLRLPGVRFAGRIVAAPEEDSLTSLLSVLGAA